MPTVSPISHRACWFGLAQSQTWCIFVPKIICVIPGVSLRVPFWPALSISLALALALALSLSLSRSCCHSPSLSLSPSLPLFASLSLSLSGAMGEVLISSHDRREDRCV